MKEKYAKDMLVVKEDIGKIKELYGLSNNMFNYDNFCIHPNLDLWEGYKIPKFETFNETGNHRAFRGYYDQIVRIGQIEVLLMGLFSWSLSGEALEWFISQELRKWSNWGTLAKEFAERFTYNIEVVPN